MNDLKRFVTYRRDQARALEDERKVVFLRLGHPERRMTASEDMAYWSGFYAGQADAYQVVMKELKNAGK